MTCELPMFINIIGRADGFVPRVSRRYLVIVGQVGALPYQKAVHRTANNGHARLRTHGVLDGIQGSPQPFGYILEAVRIGNRAMAVRAENVHDECFAPAIGNSRYFVCADCIAVLDNSFAHLPIALLLARHLAARRFFSLLLTRIFGFLLPGSTLKLLFGQMGEILFTLCFIRAARDHGL